MRRHGAAGLLASGGIVEACIDPLSPGSISVFSSQPPYTHTQTHTHRICLRFRLCFPLVFVTLCAVVSVSSHTTRDVVAVLFTIFSKYQLQ